MKKIALRLAAMIMLFGIFGFSTTSIAEATHPEVITVQYTDLTPQQKEVLQKGEPNYELLDGERIILVYDYNKEACQLPKTGTNSTMIMVNLGILALTGAGYFLVSNKNGKKFILIVGLVLSGASFVEEDCTIYIGYIRENNTTTTTEASTTAEVTTSETTTEEQSTTTTETTTETTTTEETTTEQTYTVVPTDHF